MSYNSFVDILRGHECMCWPLPYAEREELHHIKDTHFVCPVPLFNLTGNLIMPYAVNEMLQGATVLIRFNLVARSTMVGMLAGCLPDHMVLLS
jgi:hypothetical protein